MQKEDKDIKFIRRIGLVGKIATGLSGLVFATGVIYFYLQGDVGLVLNPYRSPYLVWGIGAICSGGALAFPSWLILHNHKKYGLDKNFHSNKSRNLEYNI